MTTILQGIGWFLLKIYEFFESAHIPAAYALSLVVFTILVKIVLFPLSYKGKKSMMKMTALQSKMKTLEQQYANNRQKYQEEVQKLYERENVNPMGGCLWSLLPLPILMGLYYIIRMPMHYMMRIPSDAISTAIDAVTNAGYTLSANSAYKEIQLAGMLNNSDVLTVVQNAIPDYADKLHYINFNLFGLDLSQVPHLKFWSYFSELGVWGAIGLFLIPLAVTALNFWYTRYSMKTNAAMTAPADEGKKKKKKDDGKTSSTERSNQMMMWMMPLMYLWFGYSMPAGMCVYMAVNALCTVGQDAICSKMMRKEFLKMQEEQRIREEQEKAELAARKAEIAERRRLQEEANKANKGKKGKKKPAQKKQPANKNGRIGIRTYALGRDYDPDRFGGVTTYRDPQEIIDEQAIEEAYSKKRSRKQKAVAEALSQAEEAGDLEAVKKLEEQQADLEAQAEAAEEAIEATEETVEEAAEAIVEETGEASEQEPASADELFSQINDELSNDAPSDEN
jgi:YidC/Oxa1 family membrane protein insertase